MRENLETFRYSAAVGDTDVARRSVESGAGSDDSNDDSHQTRCRCVDK